jgi:hypothetical protein
LSWVPHIVQNFVNAEHISLSHLKYEEALLTPGNNAGGKSFVITDPNPPITFQDIYTLLSTCAATPFETIYVSPIFLLLISYPIELYCLTKAVIPILDWILPELPGDVSLLQPTLFSISCAHVVATDAAAQKSIKEGGIGYRGIYTTLEGMCQEIKNWNDEHRDAYPQRSVDAQTKHEIQNIGTVPAAAGG